MSVLDNILDISQSRAMTANGQSHVDSARAELTQLRADLKAAQERIAQLETTIALNRYMTPPFDLIDDATAKLALECAEKDRSIAEQARQLELLKSALSDQEKYWHDIAIEQARQLAEAQRIIGFFKSLAVLDEMDAWLAANPAPQEPQP